MVLQEMRPQYLPGPPSARDGTIATTPCGLGARVERASSIDGWWAAADEPAIPFTPCKRASEELAARGCLADVLVRRLATMCRSATRSST